MPQVKEFAVKRTVLRGYGIEPGKGGFETFSMMPETAPEMHEMAVPDEKISALEVDFLSRAGGERVKERGNKNYIKH